MMKSTLLKTVLTGAVLLGASMSAANASYLKTTTWTVSNTGANDCSDSSAPMPGHGLYTGNTWVQVPCQADRHYGFDASQSTFTKYESDSFATTAVLDAVAYNNNGWKADINIDFFDFDITSRNKMVKEGGTVENNWEYYHDFSGSITLTGSWFDNNNVEHKASHLFNIQYDKNKNTNKDNSTSYAPGKPAMQVGLGANDKTIDFGASVWVDAVAQYSDYNNLPVAFGDIFDWDLNMNLTNKTTVEVPAPAGLGIFALGLFGLAAARKRKTA